MYSKKQFVACLSLLLALTLISQCEAFTAGAGGFKNGKRSSAAKQGYADLADVAFRLRKMCSVARAYCSDEFSEGKVDQIDRLAREVKTGEEEINNK